MSTDINFLIEKATSPLLLDMEWETTLRIVDLIRQGDISPKAATHAFLSRLEDSNPNIALLALQVLESVVKNCGQTIHEYVATRDFMESIYGLLQRNTNDEVQKKALMILAAWVYAFRKEPKYRAVQDTVNILKAEGYHVPTVIESDAMFTADRAPEWADGGCCHRCRSPFTMLRRKHHCRACGQVFCRDCSFKSSTIPKFGIEREVRVCDSCYEDINNPQPASLTSAIVETVSPSVDSTATKKSENTKSAEELQEEEEMQLALALSKSEAEDKEKEKLRATSNILGGGWRRDHSPPPPATKTSPSYQTEKEEVDPELAKYLNRSYWEDQKQKQQTTTEVARNPSAPISCIISPSPKINEVYQNGETEEVDDFVSRLKSQLEIFVNRMKSNQSRGRPIANDTAVQSLFVNITDMHAQLLKYIQQQDNRRVYCEHLQDKISQIRDERAALEALREEHREKMRREREEQERIRQIQMMQKLKIMRQKKQEYLEYQRQLALHRMAESERQILSGQQTGMPPPNTTAPTGYPMSYPQYQSQPQMPPGYMYPPGENVQAMPPSMIGPFQGPQAGQPAQQGPPIQGSLNNRFPAPVSTGGVAPGHHEYFPYNMQGMQQNLPSMTSYSGIPPSNGNPTSPKTVEVGPPLPHAVGPQLHQQMMPPQQQQTQIIPQQPMPIPQQQPQPQPQPLPPQPEEPHAELISFD